MLIGRGERLVVLEKPYALELSNGMSSKDDCN